MNKSAVAMPLDKKTADKFREIGEKSNDSKKLAKDFVEFFEMLKPEIPENLEMSLVHKHDMRDFFVDEENCAHIQ